ncbi:unnamed protein product [Heligmosomoides polygyrus]|uniref:HMA domain-containing protein n=1 Tax=Heligmosomoides polygyrus TaxID=6339 RepID=A0A183FH51_HELPZ|nr:unnamed protein product [Heligmosomoides polygyrus]
MRRRGPYVATKAVKQVRGGSRIIVDVTANAAVAQITETILSLDALADLAVCRYIAESVVFDDSSAATFADMQDILMALQGWPDRVRGPHAEKRAQRVPNGA